MSSSNLVNFPSPISCYCIHSLSWCDGTQQQEACFSPLLFFLFMRKDGCYWGAHSVVLVMISLRALTYIFFACFIWPSDGGSWWARGKICNVLLSSCVVVVEWEWLTVLDVQKQYCWSSRSTECGTSSTEPAFYLNFKVISPLVEACYGLFILHPLQSSRHNL